MVFLEYNKNDWLDINTSKEGFQPIIRDIFTNIVLYSDLPYSFNLEKNEVYRYTGYHYGYFYNKHERNNEVWVTYGLKKNNGFLMAFFYDISDLKVHKRGQISKNTWKYYSYLFYNSYKKKQNNVFINYPDFLLSDLCLDIQADHNVLHRPVDSFCFVDNSISNYDRRWSSVDNYLSCGYSLGLKHMLKDHFVLSDRFMTSSFYINSFDNNKVMYPQMFFESFRYNSRFDFFIDNYCILFDRGISLNIFKYLNSLNSLSLYNNKLYFNYLNKFIAFEKNKNIIFKFSILMINMKRFFNCNNSNYFFDSFNSYLSSFVLVLFYNSLDLLKDYYWSNIKTNNNFSVSLNNLHFSKILMSFNFLNKKFDYDIIKDDTLQQKWFFMDYLSKTKLFKNFNRYNNSLNILNYFESGLKINNLSKFDLFFDKFIKNFINLKKKYIDLTFYFSNKLINKNINFTRNLPYYKLSSFKQYNANKFIGYANTCRIDKGWFFYTLNNLGYRYPVSYCDGGLGYETKNIPSIYFHYYKQDVFSNCFLFMKKFLNILSFFMKTSLNNCFDLTKGKFNFISFDLMHILYNYFNLIKGLDFSLYNNLCLKKNNIKKKVYSRFKFKKILFKTFKVLKLNFKSSTSFNILYNLVRNYISKKFLFNILYSHLISGFSKRLKFNNSFFFNSLCIKRH